VSIGWITTLSGQNGLPTIIPIPGASSGSRVKQNSKNVTLTKEEMDEIEEILKQFVVTGERYPEAIKHLTAE
jgi:pyridoxine 4-dehydrogenase